MSGVIEYEPAVEGLVLAVIRGEPDRPRCRQSERLDAGMYARISQVGQILVERGCDLPNDIALQPRTREGARMATDAPALTATAG